jgi:uncharacterized membrane protein
VQEIAGETAVMIQAPAQMLYEYLADLSRHSEWVENVSKVTQLSPGQVTVGTTYRSEESAPPVSSLTKIRMMFFFVAGLISGSKPYSEAEITALEPGKRIAWVAGIRKGDGWFNRAQWELILEPQGGATRLTQRFCYMPQTPTAARMIGAAGAEGIAQACNVSLQRLKKVVEARVANGVA